jgi:anti-anti-sigma factor
VSTVLTTAEEITLTHDVLTERSLETAWRCLEESGTSVVHLDLSATRFPTAVGLGALVVLNTELRARGGRLLLVNVPSAIHEVLTATHLVEVLDIRTESGENNAST